MTTSPWTTTVFAIEISLALVASFVQAQTKPQITPATVLQSPPPIPKAKSPALPIPTIIEMLAGSFQANDESLKQYRAPDWFRDAKFGIWSHWGPQSVPMNDGWYARTMYQEDSEAYQYHLTHYGHPSIFGYKDIIQLWHAERLDTDHLMRLYKDAGARYFVALGVHHDNFDNWDSKYHAWNSVNYGPHKDIVGMWEVSARKAGLRFGISEHLARSYSWMNLSHGADKSGPYRGVPYDGNDPRYVDLYFPKNDETTVKYPVNPPLWWEREWFYRMKDLEDRYHPDLLYSDGALPFGEIGREFLANYYNSNMAWHGGKLEAVYNLKKIEEHGDYIEGIGIQDVERGKLGSIKEEPWQTDTSIGSWFYNDSHIDYKTAGANVIRELIDIVSKNGNLLLNVPQRPDGSLDPGAEQMLEDIGAWMRKNSQGIYATRPWKVFGEGPSVKGQIAALTIDAADGSKNEAKQQYSPEDLRFTRSKDGTILYVFCLAEPGPELHIRSLGKAAGLLKTHIASIRTLGGTDMLKWKQQSDALVIQMPRDLQPSAALGVKIVLRPSGI